MLLQLSTWPEVEAYLARSTGIVVPVGSTEQHGPNGVIGTDAICAEAVARGVGERAGAMVAPTFNVGMAQHHLAFPGSITLRPSTMVAALCDWVNSLARNGFARFLFVNGHGGNIAPVTTAFSEVYAQSSLRGPGNGAAVACRLVNWWQGPRVAALSRELYGDKEGMHATPSEVAVTQYLHAEAIRDVPLEPEVAPAGSFFDAEDYRRRYPDGRIGSAPGLATPEAGGRLLAAAVDEIAAVYRAFLAAA
ncbi:MAG: creatininase family protein [Alphaproteobacteria bacterium]